MLRNSNRWVALGVLCLGSIMVMLDSSMLNVALPSLKEALHASLDQVLWMVNAYTITWAMLLITAGRLGDLYGQRRLFAIGLVVFIVGSATCGVAQSAAQLIAARTVQGVGGALLTPQTLSILQVLFQGDSRATAISVYAGLITLGPVVAQPLGGVLVTFLGWRWVFLANLPLGTVALVLGLWLVPDIRTATGRVSIDAVGVVLLGSALLFVSFGLLEGARYHWGTLAGVISIPAVLVAAIALVGFFIMWNRSRTSPLVPPMLFEDRTYALMCALFGAATIGVLALFLPLSIYLQSILGLSPLRGGLVMLPIPLTVLVLNTFVATRLVARVGVRWTLLLGLAFLGVGSVIVELSANATANWATLTGGLIVVAAGPGLLFAPLTTAAVRRVRPEMAGTASGVLNTSGQLGGVIGGAIVGVAFQSSSAALDALHTTFAVPIVVAAVAGITCLMLEPDAPDTTITRLRGTTRRLPSASASSSGNSVVPGLPNTNWTPSERSTSSNPSIDRPCAQHRRDGRTSSWPNALRSLAVWRIRQVGPKAEFEWNSLTTRTKDGPSKLSSMRNQRLPSEIERVDTVRHLLVASDGSPSARAALEYAGEVLLRSLSIEQVTVISIFEEPQTWMPEMDLAPVPQSTWDELRAASADQAEHVLQEAAQALEWFTGRVRTLARAGRPGQEIVRAAEELAADMIVIGSHRFGELRAVLLGSVQHTVVDQAPCPVLVVHSTGH
jgi:EmrB/QacA subfamily drug resistance transporter